MIPENVEKVWNDSQEMVISLHQQLIVSLRCIASLEHICNHLTKCNDYLVNIIELSSPQYDSNTIKLISSVRDEETNAEVWKRKFEKYKNRLHFPVKDDRFIRNFIKECNNRLMVKSEPKDYHENTSENGLKNNDRETHEIDLTNIVIDDERESVDSHVNEDNHKDEETHENCDNNDNSNHLSDYSDDESNRDANYHLNDGVNILHSDDDKPLSDTSEESEDWNDARQKKRKKKKKLNDKNRKIKSKNSNATVDGDTIVKKKKKRRKLKYDDESLEEYKIVDKFTCQENDCRFFTGIKRVFARHLRDHDTRKERETNRMCTWEGCGMMFKTPHNRNMHIKRIHLQLRQFPCEWPGCGFESFTPEHLRYHMRIHTKEKPHSCDWPSCDFKCSARWSLVAHRRKHTGEKPYQCNWPECNYRCSQPGTLILHKRKHTGERPYNCQWPGCEKSFSTLAGLHLHRHK